MEITLPNGQRMPVIGLGTWQAKSDVVEDSVLAALEIGYRLIDTAYVYGNEEAIGNAIKKWLGKGGKREDLFITTKLPNFGNRAADVPKYLKESLERLKLEYVDLYLIHHPFGFFEPPPGDVPPLIDFETDHIELWKAMEQEVKSGRARNIGLSNFNCQQIKKIWEIATIPPANLQVELHAFLQQNQLLDTCKQYGISVTAYAPLGSPTASAHFINKYDYKLDYVPKPLSDKTVLDIAQKLNKTPAQILLRFLIQLGTIVVPKSSSKERILENFEVLNFKISEDDVADLKALDKGENGRIFDFLFYRGVEKHPEYPFELKQNP